MQRFSLLRVLLAGLAAAPLGFVLPTVGAEAEHGVHSIPCTNPSSGATWQISIDYDRHTVDGNAARFDADTISWRNAAEGRNYTLDRKSGKLTMVVASATGGNFLYYDCKLEK